MVWIKRNLFFFIGGLVALGLLGVAGYYDYTSWSRNSDKLDKLNEIYSTLKALNDPSASPGDDKIDKTKQAREQDAQLRAWLDQARTYFQPIAPVPASTPSDPVTSASFAAALRRTVEVLRREATNATVTLPPDYAFSFQAQSSLVQFAPGSLDLLAVQLGEVKGICEILYGSGINAFDGIQRVHGSADDLAGPQSDYINDVAITNGSVIMTPYMVTFRGFSPDIAKVFANFAASPHDFVIKGINVQPAGAGGLAMGMSPGGREVMPGGPGMPPPMTGNGVPGKGGMVTVLNEQLLQVIMEIEIIKLQPKN